MFKMLQAYEFTHDSFVHPEHRGTERKGVCTSSLGTPPHANAYLWKLTLPLGISFTQVWSQHEKEKLCEL